MQIGMIGLGKMGANMAERLRRGGHDVVGFDASNPDTDVPSLEALVDVLDAPRAVWVMVPAGDPTRETVQALSRLLDEGDVVGGGPMPRASSRPPRSRSEASGSSMPASPVACGDWTRATP